MRYCAYREHVDNGVAQLLEACADLEPGAQVEAFRRIELGANHEEQHQELLLTDMLHAFFTNPLRPVYREPDALIAIAGLAHEMAGRQRPISLLMADCGNVATTAMASASITSFRAIRVWLEPFSLARRLITCGEFAEFIADGGYRKPELWLSAGWDAVKTNGWHAPLYWTSEGGDWSVFTLRGQLPLGRAGSNTGQPHQLLL